MPVTTLEMILAEEKRRGKDIDKALLVKDNPVWNNPKNHLPGCEKPTLIQLTPLEAAEEQLILQQLQQRQKQPLVEEQKNPVAEHLSFQHQTTEPRRKFPADAPRQSAQDKSDSLYFTAAAFQAGCTCGAEITLDLKPSSTKSTSSSYNAPSSAERTSTYATSQRQTGNSYTSTPQTKRKGYGS